MADDDYLSLLDNAKENLPETVDTHERFTIPDPDILQEGKITVVRNFIDISDALRRDPEHLLQFLLKELGTPGNIEGRRAVFKAKLSPVMVSGRIQSYTETFVMCSECGLPDTHMVKEGRTLVLECEACGAHRPVKAKKAIKSDLNAVQTGEIYDLFIHDVGKKGDGIGKIADYMVIVPGTVKGTSIRVKITNISGKTAFGTVTQESATR